MTASLIALCLLPAIFPPSTRAAAGETTPLRVGSKKFTESVVLGEIAAGLLRTEGLEVVHQRELGGTRVLFNALLRGDLDAYPDYTGTLRLEVLKELHLDSDSALAAALAGLGIRMTPPLGFNNTYAIGMRPEVADSLGIRRISDLRDHPELRFGLTNEFLDRGDGWPSLRRTYRLPQSNVRGLDHDLAYRALAAGRIDVMDLYSTDAEIAYYGLRVLEDDLRHFSRYDAVLLYRGGLEQSAPKAVQALRSLSGKIGETTIRRLNARVKLEREPENAVASSYLEAAFGLHPETREETLAARLWRRTLEHLFLVVTALTAGILVAIPLGVLAFKRPATAPVILGFTGILQTIPSLALLVFMIPLLGIAAPPAIAALFLYSLLPMVRNTHAGLSSIPPELEESAEALGLSPAGRLLRVELPLASRSILAGIKTSAVITVGFATLGALIGAGGYGQPILTGIRLDNYALILEGAIPAALLALAVQGLFDLAERWIVPRGLRLKPGGGR